MYFTPLILIAWFVVAAFDYGEFCHVWQLKEYRLDRFRDYISTKQGKNFLKSYLVRRMVLAFLVGLAVWFKAELFFSAVLLMIFFEIIRIANKFFTKQLRHPKITAKSMLIIAVALVIEFFAFYFSANPFEIMAFFALRFFILSLVVFLFFIPTKIAKRLVVFLAERKLKKFSNLCVIGITGSYGKTTVKNFLDQILSVRFKVISTPKNINTEIGVAKFILSGDFADKDVFVVEMGAYNIGEIKTICDMTHPEIGILTAINEQHLSLFGSIENIQKAKYELLLSLPKNGLAVTNIDNKYCREFLSDVKSEVKTFGQEKENKPDCSVDDIKIKEDGDVGFSLTVAGVKHMLDAPIVGAHNAMNIAACTLVANYLGISMTDIADQIKNLKLPDGTLQIHKYGESVIIDDSYNANPDGFKAALEILKSYPADFRKIVITRGMIELGEKSAVLHSEIGKKISQVADELVIIADNNEKDLKNGAVESGIEISTIYDGKRLFEYVQKFRSSKCLVLLENRIPANVHAELTKK